MAPLPGSRPMELRVPHLPPEPEPEPETEPEPEPEPESEHYP